MPLFTRTQADGVWISGYQPPRTDWEHLDSKQRAAINGDRGGTWAPTDGLQFGDAFNDGQVQITGPCVVGAGGVLQFVEGDIVLGPGDFPRFGPNHALRNRTILQNLTLSTQANRNDWGLHQPTTWEPFFGMQSVAISVGLLNDQASLTVPRLEIALRVHDGGTLDRVRIWFRVARKRKIAPSSTPRFRVVRYTHDGVVSTLRAANNGWSSPSVPKTAAAWSLDGAAQSFEYVCDQNNVIDKSTYAYRLEIIEESALVDMVTPSNVDGVTVLESKADVRVASTAHLTLAAGLPVIDGVTVADGDRVLVKNQNNPLQNGLYTAAAFAPWSRTYDATTFIQFTRRFLVRAAEGTTQGGYRFQLQDPVPRTVGGTNGDVIAFGAPVYLGNVYTSAEVMITNIPDMRFE